MGFVNRYSRNMNTISEKENQELRRYKVCVVGCGGLGGHIIEQLGRLGIGWITAIDGDVFEESNLNRQLFSTEMNIGKSKALSAHDRMLEINSNIKVNPIFNFVTEENCEEIIKGHDLVMDALDNILTRKLIERTCENLNIPIIHGAIAGWYGQVSTILPGDRTMEIIYPGDSDGCNYGAEEELGNPSFTPGVVASIQVAEAIKTLLNKEDILSKKLLTIDLLAHEYEVFDL